jgi:hypothetical protein
MKSQYLDIPCSSQWMSDSSTLLSTRKHDPILTRIDFLVSAYEKANASAKPIVCVDLFWTLDYWLKIFKANKNMDARREPAIYRLYSACANKLCIIFGCQVNTLVNKLEFAFARTVGEHGTKVDVELGLVKYLTAAERKQSQLIFKAGLAYQYKWWMSPVDMRQLVLAESSRAYNKQAFWVNDPNRANVGGFIMTMGRDFYMTKHGGPNAANSRIFHSSYLGNNPVCCAGTMGIVSGVVTTVCPDSGHFQPGQVNVRMMLQALRMLQVDLSNVRLHNFENNNSVNAAKALDVGTWNDVLQHMEKNTTTIMDNQQADREAWAIRNPPKTLKVNYGFAPSLNTSTPNRPKRDIYELEYYKTPGSPQPASYYVSPSSSYKTPAP